KSEQQAIPECADLVAVGQQSCNAGHRECAVIGQHTREQAEQRIDDKEREERPQRSDGDRNCGIAVVRPGRDRSAHGHRLLAARRVLRTPFLALRRIRASKSTGSRRRNGPAETPAQGFRISATQRSTIRLRLAPAYSASIGKSLAPLSTAARLGSSATSGC